MDFNGRQPSPAATPLKENKHSNVETSAHLHLSNRYIYKKKKKKYQEKDTYTADLSQTTSLRAINV